MFNTSSKYQAVTNCALTLDDYRLMVKYYQPIVGTRASSLYLTLVSELNEIFNTKMKNIKKLQVLTNLPLEVIYRELIALSKVGLLNLYRSKMGDEYIIDIIKPKDQHDFFNDAMLCKALREFVGDELFNEYIDESKRIPYSFTNYTLINPSLNSKGHDTRITKEYYLKLFTGIGLKNTPKEIDELATFSFVNKLSLEEVNDTIQKSILNGIVNIFSFKSTIKMSKLSKEDIMNNNGNDVEVFSSDDYFNIVNHTPSEIFLKRLNNGRKLSSVESNLINILRMEYRLLDPVINVLIDYVFKVNNMMLNRSLIESIAASWQRNNISSSKEAVTFVRNYNKKKSDSNVNVEKTQPKYASNTPEWLLNQMDEETLQEEIKEPISSKKPSLQEVESSVSEDSVDFDLFARFGEE